MSLVTVMATVILALAALFVLWPLLWRREVDFGPGPDWWDLSQGRVRQASFLREIEEVELDASSGRIDPEDAARRLGELGRELDAR